MKAKTGFFILFIFISFSSCKDEDTFKTDYADFEDIELEENQYWDGSDGKGGFSYGNKFFKNKYYSDWETWSGFVYSNVINYNYYNDQAKFASYPSGGANKSKVYLVARQFEKIEIEFEKGEEPRDIQIANSTYTALAIQNGYGYAKKFGGRDGTDPDWLKVSITGIGLVEEVTGTVDFFLADYRFENSEEDYIVDNWEYVDLTSLGKVKKLEFYISSSDAGTPLYFCLDNLKGRVYF